MATFGEVSSHLIDQLRGARDTARRLVESTTDRDETAFAHDVTARIDQLLDDLGCYD
jgi:hypothetical protein